jgi:hypothetical protein
MNGIKTKYIAISISTFLIFIVGFLSINLLSITFAQTTTNTLSIYKNSTYGVTIKYPNEWSIDETGGIDDNDTNIVTFSSPNQNDHATVEIHQDKPDEENSDISSYLTSETPSYNDLDDFKVIESNTNSLLAGNNAYKLIYTYTDGGTTYKDMEIGTIVGDKAFYIAYDVEESTFDSYLPIVQTMIDSFEVTASDNQS